MKNIQRRLSLLVLSFSLLSHAALAANQCPANAEDHPEEQIWSPPTTITQLRPGGDHYFFNTEFSDRTRSGCNDGTRWRLDETAPNYPALAKTLVAAFLSNSTVQLRIAEGCDCAQPVLRFLVTTPGGQ